MDEIKKLSYDLKVYKELINDYTGDPYINHTIDNLIQSIESRDIKEVILFLERLKDWYENNILKIMTNVYVSNKESHNLALGQIKAYYTNLTSETFPELDKEQIEKETSLDYRELTDSNEGYNIFVSHSSKDEEVCTAFVHLLETLGVPEKNILYSSSERFGIPGDMDIFDYLKSSISQDFTVYYMLSDNYYDSVYCLNEMGAAWINQNDFSTYILPNFTKAIDGVIDGRKKGYRLDNKISLNQLRTKISNDFNSTISNDKWDEEKEKFLSVVNQYQ